MESLSPEAPPRLERESQASERYLQTCKRLTALPEPLLLRTLRKPYEHSGEYSTAKAEIHVSAAVLYPTACRLPAGRTPLRPIWCQKTRRSNPACDLASAHVRSR